MEEKRYWSSVEIQVVHSCKLH